MSQYFINIGALPNDGTGDPLRTAFNDTNLNFDQIFAAGPVLSNVQIVGNKILTLNTNGNLVLSPNGVGRVVSNVSIVPNTSNTHDLGSPSLRWNTVYSTYMDFANLSVTGNLVAGNIFSGAYYYANGDPFIGGAGGVIQSNVAPADPTSQTLWWDEVSGRLYVWYTDVDGSQWVDAAPATGFGGGGGANLLSVTSSIIPAANVTYGLGNATNQWANLWVSGNTIYLGGVPLTTSGNTLSVNGAPVSGGGSNISNGTSNVNIVSSGGNVTVGVGGTGNVAVFATTGLVVTGITSATGNITGGNILTAGIVSATGNITSNYFIGNGSQLTGISAGSVDWANVTNKTGNLGPTSIAVGRYANAGANSVSLGTNAGAIGQSYDSVAIGLQAGETGQEKHSVAIGTQAGHLQQGEDAVAIGWNAGRDNQTRWAVAIGYNAGYLNQSFDGVAIGQSAGRSYQGADAVAIGRYAGYSGNSVSHTYSDGPYYAVVLDSVSDIVVGQAAVGNNITPGTLVSAVYVGNSTIALSTGFYPGVPSDGDTFNFHGHQGHNSVAIGATSGFTDQGANSVAVGAYAGYISQQYSSVAVGYRAGYTGQQQRTVALGEDAGHTNQGEDAVAIGQRAGYSNQGKLTVAIGNTAGYNSQGQAAVAVGLGAGNISQGYSSVAIGYFAGNNVQGYESVAVGEFAAIESQGPLSVAIGTSAGANHQGTYSVAVGTYAGSGTALGGSAWSGASGTNSLKIFNNAQVRPGQLISAPSSGAIPPGTTVLTVSGEDLTISQNLTQSLSLSESLTFLNPQGSGAVALGYNSGSSLQGQYAVALGYEAGATYQAGNSVAIGFRAGYYGQGNNSIIINATGANLDNTTDNTFTVAPVRNDNSNVAEVMFYNTTSKEVTYGNTISVAGNITGGNVSTGVIALTNGAVIKDTATYAVAFGKDAGLTSQGQEAVAVGHYAGRTSQGNGGVAIGVVAGNSSQGQDAVAVGSGAGRTNQGSTAVAVGSNAGATNQGNNSIIINATGSVLNQTTANTFTVKPVRQANTANAMYYDASTGEITYDTAGGGANTGNVTFSDQIVIGTGISNLVSGLYLAPSSSSANAVQYLRVRGDVTYEPTHIHFDTGNNQYFNQFIGDDNKYVLLSNTGNIVINTDNYVGNSAQWTFDTTGNLTVPGNIVTSGALGDITGANLITANTFVTTGAAPVLSSGNNLTLLANSASYVFSQDGVTVCPVIAYSSLPSAITPGQRAFINDSNLVATGNFGQVVGNGASNVVPIYSDGSDWRIG